MRKVINRKGNKVFVKWLGFDPTVVTLGLMQRILFNYCSDVCVSKTSIFTNLVHMKQLTWIYFVHMSMMNPFDKYPKYPELQQSY